MKLNCPTCKASIPAANINAATDVAVCHQCSEAFALSELVAAQDVPPDFDIHDPPEGAWFHDEYPGWRIGASTRSWTACLLVPFVCVWSGFSLGGIYGSQLVSGEFNPVMSLFGVPFVLGSLALGCVAIMSICGRVDVIVADTDGRIFTGVGPFGWTRRFDWSEVTRIEEDASDCRSSGSTGYVISLAGKTRLKCGSMVSDARRYYLLQGLRVLRQRT